jgi:hypothetical protein
LNCTINEQHTLILFLAEMFQKLKFKLLHHSLYSVDLTFCDSHFFWTAEKIIIWLLIFKMWERVSSSQMPQRSWWTNVWAVLVRCCAQQHCFILTLTNGSYQKYSKWCHNCIHVFSGIWQGVHWQNS